MLPEEFRLNDPFDADDVSAYESVTCSFAVAANDAE